LSYGPMIVRSASTGIQKIDGCTARWEY